MTHTNCELCSSSSNVSTHEVSQTAESSFQNTALLCSGCLGQIEDPTTMNANHWHCLNESIWSENPAVKVLAWRVLKKLPSEAWAQDLLDQLYMEDELLDWAKSGEQTAESSEASGAATKDSNGTALVDGDSVTLIKDLEVKGAGFTAKRGTVVKKITLTGDPGLVEGKVNGTTIVLKTCFLKKVV
ncbi:PhnA domain-containing protein [Bdellovibrionota bacterium FG-2]